MEMNKQIKNLSFHSYLMIITLKLKTRQFYKERERGTLRPFV